MIRRTVLTAMAVALAAATVSAEDNRVELSATFGWTFSDGVGGANTVLVPGVGTFNKIDPKDAASWGLRLGYLVNDNGEVGFLYNQQATELEVGGTKTVKVGDQKISNYHGYYAYNGMDIDSNVRPYFLIGLGATQYGAVAATVNGVNREIAGNTKFSGTTALGVKLFPSPKFGIRLEGRWTPTYIKTDATGYWCDPYWGCYTVGDAQYSNQFEVGGGITIRF